MKNICGIKDQAPTARNVKAWGNAPGCRMQKYINRAPTGRNNNQANSQERNHFALSGLSVLGEHNLGLTPQAFTLRPFGALKTVWRFN